MHGNYKVRARKNGKAKTFTCSHLVYKTILDITNLYQAVVYPANTPLFIRPGAMRDGCFCRLYNFCYVKKNGGNFKLRFGFTREI